MKEKTYLFSYSHNGARWSFEVQASDQADAQARVRKMANASLDGTLVARIPASMGFLPRFLVSVRNTLAYLNPKI